MRKIKDNGRTYKLVTHNDWSNPACGRCAYYKKIDCPEDDEEKLLCCKVADTKNHFWRETLPSKLSRLIKRIIQVRTEKQLRKRMQKITMRTPKDDPEIHSIVAESFWDYF